MFTAVFVAWVGLRPNNDFLGCLGLPCLRLLELLRRRWVAVSYTHLAEELTQLCRDNLPDYKVPRSMLFTDRVLRNPAGKTLRKDLSKAAGEPS